MRKLISLGLLALLLSIFASPVMAGGAAECDGLKEDETAPRGLYGLCTAYYSAENGRGQERVEQLYAKKAIAAGYPPEIPRLELPQEPDPPEVACPCWPGDEMAGVPDDSAPAFECQVGTDPEFAIYGSESFALVTFQVFPLNEDPDSPIGCMYVDNRSGGGMSADFDLDGDEEYTCRAGIQALVGLDFGGSCL